MPVGKKKVITITTVGQITDQGLQPTDIASISRVVRLWAVS